MKPVQIPSFMSIGTMVIELREFKKNGQNVKTTVSSNLKKWYFSEIFCTQFCFDIIYCKVIRSRIDLKLKVRTEFPNVWGEYIYRLFHTLR